MAAGMVFDTYRIRSPQLLPYVQYILFNHSDDPACRQQVTSFANTNICLGIINGKQLYESPDGVKRVTDKAGIHSYLSGMYLQPHKFEACGTLDEICIDLSPLGYYHFFRFPAKIYIFEEDILTEGFGIRSKQFFERVFEVSGFQQRGAMIETFLLRKIVDANKAFVAQALYYIHHTGGVTTLREIALLMQCSEKKIVRAFLQHFDLTPKDYMRIVRFRKTLKNLNDNKDHLLTSVGYDSDYFDQSHFIRDFKFFTGNTPREIRQSLLDIKQQVIVGVR